MRGWSRVHPVDPWIRLIEKANVAGQRCHLCRPGPLAVLRLQPRCLTKTLLVLPFSAVLLCHYLEMVSSSLLWNRAIRRHCSW